MPDEIISYLEMCRREKTRLRRGMNFNLDGTHSVILMSARSDAPYHDRFEDDGATLVYEGHDQSRTVINLDPKRMDQPAVTSSGALTQNGLFFRAAQRFKSGQRDAERVRVYEKIHPAVWSYNGVFHLVDAWQETDGERQVFKFKLAAVEGEEDFVVSVPAHPLRRRLVPSHVKLEVWQRDSGKCVVCGATEDLHFDHDLPCSTGGPSITAKNVRLLCARHRR
ncbi:MAG: HNH endonuclease [Rhodospirillales bacterium]|nr:HNH endonuclease [Acetobacter sp.]